MSILVTDRQSYNITRREWTDQGYLRVPGRVARTGVQYYLAQELQLTDRKPDEVVGVYRPPGEVFDADSLTSYEDVDVTLDHPPNLVDAASYKRHAVGHTTDAARQEDNYVVVDLIIKDQDAIKAVETGKAALSAGYEAVYEHAPGRTEDGEPYEFIQKDIRINHVALVDKGRAGNEARLLDHAGGTPMATVTLDGQAVEVGDNATAQLVQRAFDEANKSYKDMESKAKEMEDEAAKLRKQVEEMEATKDKALEDLEEAKKAASDEAIQERIKAVSDAKSQAAKIAGSDFTCDSLDVTEIKRNALSNKRPTVDWNDKSEHYVLAAWDIELENAKADPASASHDRFAADMQNLHTDDAAMGEGRAAYNEFLSGGKH